METVFKEGDKVYCVLYGHGVVKKVYNEGVYRVAVDFGDETEEYTLDGRLYSHSNPTLSLTEYTLQGFSQERPIILPEVGEFCLVRNEDNENWLACKFIEYSTISRHPFVVNMQMFTLDTNCFKQMKRIKILD